MLSVIPLSEWFIVLAGNKALKDDLVKLYHKVYYDEVNYY